MTSIRNDLGGWRRDVLWNAVTGHAAADTALFLIGAGPGTQLHDRACVDLEAARQAFAGGDRHTAEALIDDLAVTSREARMNMSRRPR